MPTAVLLASIHRNDQELGAQLAEALAVPLFVVHNRHEARFRLVREPACVALFDAETTTACDSLSMILPKYLRPRQLIALSDGPLGRYRHLLTRGHFFSTHVQRCPAPRLLEFLRTLAQATTDPGPPKLRLADLLSSAAPIQSLHVRDAIDRRAAVDAMDGFLRKKGLIPRVASIVARAVDEALILAESAGPRVRLEFGTGKSWMGVGVSDRSGALTDRDVFDGLFNFYRGVHTKPSARLEGIGAGIVPSYEEGVSWLVVAVPKARNETIALFPAATSYREFKKGSRFLSVICGKPGPRPEGE